MGALSSWGMLALTHHFIVQVAAWRVGFPKHKLFKQYAVLGDDLVVGNASVARSYLYLMENIGVGINLSKSILSFKGRGLEFAKRTVIDGVDCSPISLKDLSISLEPGNISSWAAFAKSHKLDFVNQVKILGFGYKTSIGNFRKMCHALQLVWLVNVAKLDFNSSILAKRSKTPVEFDNMLPLFKKDVLKPAISALMRDMNSMSKMSQDYISLYLYDTKGLAQSLLEFTRCGLPWKVVVSLFRGFSHMIAHYTIVTIQKDLGQAFYGIYDLHKLKTFDDGIKAYLKLIRDRATYGLNLLRIDSGNALTRSSRLPYQARLFRAWSRLTHRMVKRLREENSNSGKNASKEE